MTIDIEKFLAELEILVNMDSGQGNPEGITAVGKYFADRMVARGWLAEQVDVGEATGKCTIIKNREADHYDVMLVGHVDTVFPKGETAKRPFRRDDEKAYGLGTIDMKQGDLAMLYIMEQLPPEVSDTLNILAIYNPDEEIGSVYSKDCIDEYAKICDYAFIFEGASTDCGAHTVQRKGAYRAKVEFFGRAGHAGYLFTNGSISAINELLYWATELNKLCDPKTGTSVNIAKVSGGEKYNIVPDYAKLEFEARYETMDEYERLLEVVEGLKAHATKVGVKVDASDNRATPPLVPTEKTLEYEKRLYALGERIGIPYVSRKRGGLSDANHIAAQGTVCVDGLGPTGDHDHSEFEYLEISTVEPNLRFAYEMVCDLAEMKKGK